MKLFVATLSLALLPQAALAHTGHETQGILAQFFNIEHVFANAIAFVLMLLLGMYMLKKRKQNNI